MERADVVVIGAGLGGLAAWPPGGGADRTYNQLGISRCLHLERLDPIYAARFPGLEVVAPADRFRYEPELIGLFPDQAEGIRGLLDELVAAHADSRRLTEDHAAGRPPQPWRRSRPATRPWPG